MWCLHFGFWWLEIGFFVPFKLSHYLKRLWLLFCLASCSICWMFSSSICLFILFTVVLTSLFSCLYLKCSWLFPPPPIILMPACLLSLNFSSTSVLIPGTILLLLKPTISSVTAFVVSLKRVWATSRETPSSCSRGLNLPPISTVKSSARSLYLEVFLHQTS